MADDDIEAIIAKGEERTQELNSKYEQLNLEDLRNFKSDAGVQQWEGEDFRGGVCIPLSSLPITMLSIIALEWLLPSSSRQACLCCSSSPRSSCISALPSHDVPLWPINGKI